MAHLAAIPFIQPEFTSCSAFSKRYLPPKQAYNPAQSFSL